MRVSDIQQTRHKDALLPPPTAVSTQFACHQMRDFSCTGPGVQLKTESTKVRPPTPIPHQILQHRTYPPFTQRRRLSKLTDERNVRVLFPVQGVISTLPRSAQRLKPNSVRSDSPSPFFSKSPVVSSIPHRVPSAAWKKMGADQAALGRRHFFRIWERIAEMVEVGCRRRKGRRRWALRESMRAFGD